MALSFTVSFAEVAFSLAALTLSNALDFVELALSVIDLSLSFVSDFTSALIFSILELGLTKTLVFDKISDSVANAEPDTANVSDVNVKSDFKDFIKTPVLLLIGSTSELVC